MQRDLRKAHKTSNCAGFAQSRNSRMSDNHKQDCPRTVPQLVYKVDLCVSPQFHDIIGRQGGGGGDAHKICLTQNRSPKHTLTNFSHTLRG